MALVRILTVWTILAAGLRRSGAFSAHQGLSAIANRARGCSIEKTPSGGTRIVFSPLPVICKPAACLLFLHLGRCRLLSGTFKWQKSPPQCKSAALFKVSCVEVRDEAATRGGNFPVSTWSLCSAVQPWSSSYPETCQFAERILLIRAVLF